MIADRPALDLAKVRRGWPQSASCARVSPYPCGLRCVPPSLDFQPIPRSMNPFFDDVKITSAVAEALANGLPGFQRLLKLVTPGELIRFVGELRPGSPYAEAVENALRASKLGHQPLTAENAKMFTAKSWEDLQWSFRDEIARARAKLAERIANEHRRRPRRA